MSKLGWVLVGLCALIAHRHSLTFASDLALWQRAHVVSPTNVRPAVNIAAQYLIAGQPEMARWWIEYARTLVAAPERAFERDAVLQVLERQETWINAFSPSR